MIKSRGFTLIELLVTLAILSVLALLTVPLAQLSARRVDEAELRHALREIRNAIDAYKLASDEGRIERPVNSSGYPPTLNALVEGVKDAKDPKRRMIYFLRRVPRNPLADSSLSDEQGWGLRAYSSEPHSPVAGDDVFDVFPRSDGVGLNSIPYRKW